MNAQKMKEKFVEGCQFGSWNRLLTVQEAFEWGYVATTGVTRQAGKRYRMYWNAAQGGAWVQEK